MHKKVMHQRHITVRVQRSRQIDFSSAIVWGVIVAPMGIDGRVVEVRLRGYNIDRLLILSDEDLAWRQRVPDMQWVRPETMLMFFDALETGSVSDDGNPIWSASAAEDFGKAPGRSVMYGHCRVTVNPGDSSHRTKAHVDILQAGDARLIRSLDDLWGFYAEFMDASIHGVENNANSVIRIISPESGQAITMWVYCARERQSVLGPKPGDAPRNFTLPAGVNKTWEEAIVKGEQAKGLVRVLAAALGEKVLGLSEWHAKLADDLRSDLRMSKLIIEAIPGQRIRVVGVALNDVDDPTSRLAVAQAKCAMKSKSGEPKFGFVEMTLGLMISPPKGGGNQPYTSIVTKLVPPNEVVAVFGVDTLPTPNYQPGAKPINP